VKRPSGRTALSTTTHASAVRSGGIPATIYPSIVIRAHALQGDISMRIQQDWQGLFVRPGHKLKVLELHVFPRERRARLGKEYPPCGDALFRDPAAVALFSSG